MNSVALHQLYRGHALAAAPRRPAAAALPPGRARQQQAHGRRHHHHHHHPSSSNNSSGALQRRRVEAAASASSSGGDDIGDAYDNLFKSSVFQSEVAVREFDSITTELRQLSMMASRFADFDTTGKRMYLDKMREASGRYRIFIKRLELSGDPAAREYLRATNAQMLEGGFTLGQMFEGLEQSLGQYEQIVTQEEQLLGDPQRHAEFTAALKERWAASAMGRIDMSYLARVMDPQVLNRAQRDPEFFKAIREISDSPTPATLQKWIDHPAIGPLVSEMFKAMMNKSFGAS